MNVLLIGGTRFVGYLVAWRLVARGDRVTLFNRGSTPDPFGPAVERVRGDRTSDDLARFLRARGKSFDAIVDFAAYQPSDVTPVLDALESSGASDVHYVFISTGQVYLVLASCPRPAKEEDYAGVMRPEPDRATDPDEHAQWAYGAGKRGVEDLLADAHRRRGVPVTSVRIPIVNGERDYLRRIEGYLWRLVDGGPIILPGGGEHTVRHAYGADVARTIADLLGEPKTFGRAYNLTQDEQPKLVEVLGELASLLGVRPSFVDVPREAVIAAGLDPVGVSPFSGKWMSCLDPARAKAELGFTHRSVARYLDNIVQSFLASPPDTRPEPYAARAKELALVEGRRRS